MRTALIAACLALLAVPAAAQMPPNPEARVEAQRAAMAQLSFMDGIWRGPAWALLPSGRQEFVQTERVGPFLGGAVRVVEGRGYAAGGSVAFNALGVLSYDPDRRAYSLQSWAQGYSVTSILRVEGNRVIWEAPAGPGAVVRHTATIGDGTWHEVSERIAGDAPPVQVAELNLRRVSDTDWPAGDPVPMR